MDDIKDFWEDYEILETRFRSFYEPTSFNKTYLLKLITYSKTYGYMSTFGAGLRISDMASYFIEDPEDWAKQKLLDYLLEEAIQIPEYGTVPIIKTYTCCDDEIRPLWHAKRNKLREKFNYENSTTPTE